MNKKPRWPPTSLRVLIRHLNSKESAVSVALTQVEPDAWQAVWDSEIAPQMAQLIKKPGYSM